MLSIFRSKFLFKRFATIPSSIFAPPILVSDPLISLKPKDPFNLSDQSNLNLNGLFRPARPMLNGAMDPVFEKYRLELDQIQEIKENHKMFALKILKIRKRKMNRHKWKKRSRISKRSSKNNSVQKRKQE